MEAHCDTMQWSANNNFPLAMVFEMIFSTPMSTSEATPFASCVNSVSRSSSSRFSRPRVHACNTVTPMCERTQSGLSLPYISIRNHSSPTPQNLSMSSSSQRPMALANAMRSPLSCPSVTKSLWSTWLPRSTVYRIPMNYCNSRSSNLLERTRCKTPRIG